MFTTPRSRYLLRAIVASVLAGAGVAGTIWISNPYVQVVSASAAALGAYLGIGAAVPQVEPNIGRKL